MKPTTTLILLLLILPCFSCDQAAEPVKPVEQEAPVDPVLDVTCDESGTEYEVYQFMRSASHTTFARLLGDKGYHVYFDDAVHFVGMDRETGHKGHMTLIPCAVPGDDSRIAMIQYFRGNGRYASTAAEYFKDEDYGIAHPVDELALLSYTLEDTTYDKLDILERSEKSKRYWGCVANRFISGCAGCATVCYLAGPFWGPCTAKCCAGSAVVALLSCAFTVYIGW